MMRELLESNKRALRLTFDALPLASIVVAVRPADAPTAPLDEAHSRARVALAKWEGKIGEVLKDFRLSQEARRDDTLAARKAVQDAIAALDTAARETAEKVAQERAALFALPQLDKTDAAGAAYDREIRERFASLSEHQRAEALKDPRIVEALSRDPFPSAPREAARATLQAQIEKARAADLARIDARAEHAQWAQANAAAFTALLDRTAAEWGPPRRTALDVANDARAAAAAPPPPTPAPKPVREYKPVTMERAEEILRDINAAESAGIPAR